MAKSRGGKGMGKVSITGKQRAARKRNIVVAQRSKKKGGKKKMTEEDKMSYINKVLNASKKASAPTATKKISFSSANITRSTRRRR